MNPFEVFMTETIYLLKKTTGQQLGPYKCALIGDTCQIDDKTLDVDLGDTIMRTLPNNKKNYYTVLRVDYREDFPPIPGGYGLTLRKENQIPKFADKITNQNQDINTGNYVGGSINGGNVASGDIHIHNYSPSTENKLMLGQKTILIVAANPSNETRLRLDVEARDIDEGLRLAKHRDQFVLKQQQATRVRDLRRAMQDHEPTIVHFCGHGSGERGIVLEDNDGKTQLVSTEALANFFELFTDEVECVVLNACFSELQAKEIVKHIPYVIGMAEGIGDKAAIEFAVAFYDSLAAGKEYEKAYKFACSAIEMAGITGHLIPLLFKKMTNISKSSFSKNIMLDNQISDSRPIKLFYSYSHKDEILRDKLETHLKLLQRQGVIDTWHDRKIGVGTEWQQVIDENLETADIILLLVSADFLASDYCFDIEIKRAMQRHQDKSAVVIPISLRPCDTTGTPLMALQGLPKDFKPVIKWEHLDDAFTDIAKGIRAVAEKIHNRNTKLPLSNIITDTIDIKVNLTTESRLTKRSTIFNVPIPRNPFFTGRNDILVKLHEALQSKNEIAIKPSKKATALSSLGGVGKTQTVAEYAHRYKDEYAAVLWVLADGKDLLRSSFAQLSVLLGFKAEKQDDQILAVQSWLRNNDAWLLIFDNAETLELLTAAKELLPSSANGRVLFTTRAQFTGNLTSITFDCFDDDTGAVFLLRRSKWVATDLATLEQVRPCVSDKDWQTATTLVHELGGLPLAINQAAAYIEQTGCDLEGYLSRYRDNAAVMLKERGGLANHPESVYKTILLAIEKAEKRHPLAGEILRDSALLHPDGISEKLYADCDPLDLYKALEALEEYSLIQRVPEKQLFTVHRLVQVVIQDVCDG